MFLWAKSFNQPLVTDTLKVVNMRDMFAHTKSFNQALQFDTSNVRHMCIQIFMFYNTKAYL